MAWTAPPDKIKNRTGTIELRITSPIRPGTDDQHNFDGLSFMLRAQLLDDANWPIKDKEHEADCQADLTAEQIDAIKIVLVACRQIVMNAYGVGS